MKKDLTLLILAGGMGSRFGGLKQIEPVGPNGEFIIDYSIYDAIKVGFNKVVFIIKEENYEIFKETIGKRIEDHIKVEYCFQKIDNIPKNVIIPSNRVKPWGTAHAVLSAKKFINGNFAMINSDDFYGRDAYIKIKKFFDENKNNDYATVLFHVINTMTDFGSVKRGVAEEDSGYLVNLIESSIENNNSVLKATPLDGRDTFNIKPEQLVSMNFFGFNYSIFDALEKGMISFFNDNKNNLTKAEYLIPDVVFDEVKNNKKVKVLSSTDKWLGVTYREDTANVIDSIKKLIDKGVYPNNLWK